MSTTTEASGTVLVVDDDPLIVNSIALALEHEGLAVLQATDGQSALQQAADKHPDLVILDVGLPDLSGVEVCRRLRAQSDAQVLFLTARQDEVDKVVALDAGGDDYVTKPVGLAELAARVRAHLRRRASYAGRATTQFVVGDIRVDAHARTVAVGGRPVQLTPREFALLLALVERQGEVVERRQLLDQVWGTDWFGDQNVLDVYVRQLRIKMEPDPDRPAYLKTVRGVGYSISAP